MRPILTIAAFGGLAYAIRHFLNFLKHNDKRRLTEKKLEVWEGEGGAVPVAKTRTAAQVKAKKARAVSPRDVN